MIRLERLELENFRSYAALDLDLRAVSCAALVGSNGAGKSSIAAAVEWSLFGGKADNLIRWGEAKGGVSLTLSVGEERWVINRTRLRDSKSLLVLTRDGQVLDTHTVAAAQEMIESLLGFDQAAYRATVYSPQGEVGALARMSPSERKALLASLVGLERYEGWREEASVAAREVTAKVTMRQGIIADIQAQLVTTQAGMVDPVVAVARAQETAGEVQRLDAELAVAHEREAAVAQVRLRERLKAQMSDIKAQAERHREVTAEREKLEAEINAAGSDVRERLVAAQAAMDAQRMVLAEAHGERQRLLASLGAQRADDAALHQRLKVISDRELEVRRATVAAEGELKLLDGDGATCVNCGQVVDGEHRVRARLAASTRLKAGEEKLTVLAEERRLVEADRAVVQGSVKAAEAEVQGFVMPTVDDGEVLACQRDVDGLVKAEAKLAAIPTPVAVDELRKQWAALRDEAKGLPAAVPEGPSVLEVSQALARAGAAEREAEVAVDEYERSVKLVESLTEQVDKNESLVAVDAARAEALRMCERAFSRNGIPSLILDTVVGGIETATNDLLEQLGSEMRVSLLTQAEKKDGSGFKDTLEIVVDDGQHRRPLGTFSGGEATRVNVALRLGLAQVLSANSGVEADFVIVDEPEGLDAEGLAALSDVLPRTGRQVMLVSHAAPLVDAMPQKIMVQREAGGTSTVTVT